MTRNTQKPGYGVRNVKLYPGHEGEACAYGDITLDGKVIGTFRQDGHGGPCDIHIGRWDSPERKAFDAYCEALPAIHSEYGDLKMNSELWCEERANEFLDAKSKASFFKSLRKRMLTQTCFMEAGVTNPEDGYRTIKMPFDARVKAHIAKKYPGATILNETLGGQEAK